MILLLDHGPDFGSNLVENPLELLPLLKRAIMSLQKSLIQEGVEGCVKPNVHPRIPYLPSCSSSWYLKSLPKSQDIGKMVVISGTVTRIGMLKVFESQARFECTKCGNGVWIDYDLSTASFPKPRVCENKSDEEECRNTSFKQVTVDPEMGNEHRNYQEIRLQENIDKLKVGTIPRAMSILLLDDLVDQCKAGDSVTITGIVRRQWLPFVKNETIQVKVIIEANHVFVHNSEEIDTVIDEQLRMEFQRFWEENSATPLKGRDVILSSFCPQIYGLHVIKLSLLLVLIGGVQKFRSGLKIRGESHILLVGDPGTGKSQLLKFACKLIPRAVLTTGIGSTSAGLTCTAVKDSGDWQLEAGALVLADGGLCCIDEFGSIRKHDKSSILEAMEQQTLSVAKAGLVCKLNTRCSIIAATNPKGNYDCQQNLEVNTALSSPLLSRFDLIFVLLDILNKDWDRTISSFILNSEMKSKQTQQESGVKWSVEKLKGYIAYCKTLKPSLTPPSERILSAYYQLQRRSDLRNTARTTIRSLESLIRLSQAHARLMCHTEVTKEDAIIAVVLVESSVLSSGILPPATTLHSVFPSDPDGDFAKTYDTVMQKLNVSLEPTSQSKQQLKSNHTTQSRYAAYYNNASDDENEIANF